MLTKWLGLLLATFAGIWSGGDYNDEANFDTEDVVETRAHAPRPHRMVVMAQEQRHVAIETDRLNLDRDEQAVWVGRLDRRVVAQASMKTVEPFVSRVRVRHEAMTWPPEALYEAMLGAAAEQSWQQGDIKLTVDGPLGVEQVRRMIEPRGFNFWRVRPIDDGTAVEFYVNLYVTPDHERAHRRRA